MKNEKGESVETSSTPQNNEPKKIVIAEQIVQPSVWLQFTGFDDLKELIQFTGTKPRINEDGSLRISKYNLVAPCMIQCDSLGNIQEVLNPSEFKALYNVKDQKVFSGSFSAKNK